MAKRIRHSLPLAVAFALAAFLSQTAPLSAEHETQRGTLSDASYQRMRQYARELDERAQHANEQAQNDQRGQYRRDPKFLKSISHFAKRTNAFHDRMDEYRTRPWNVDEELRHLLQDARNVQERLRRARFADSHTRQDWDRVVALLNRMSREYQSGLAYGSSPNRNDTNDYRHDDDDREGHQHGSRGSGYEPDGYGDVSDLRQLAHQLQERASRANELARRAGIGDYASAIEHFSEQADSFHSRVDGGRLSSAELRSQVVHLLEDAQRAQDELSRRNVSSQLRNEWSAVVQILTRMRDLAAV